MLSPTVRVVLVETSHPGNIGAVARAMKNSDLNRLYLVSPKLFPHAEATARASGADDILYSASICGTLDEAIADCKIVIGSSARSRSIRWPEIGPRECANIIANNRSEENIAILFGREHSGLTNDELDRCNFLLKIPTNPNFSSLNLASAVLIVAYELFLVSKPVVAEEIDPRVFATSSQLESFFQHLYLTLCELGFIHPDKSKSIMRRLRRLFNRARLEEKEIDILRGILSAAQGKKMKSERSSRNGF